MQAFDGDFHQIAQDFALSFRFPDDPNKKIWRYMDLSKFIWMLQRSKLYFARADTLGDPFEGSITKKNWDDRRKRRQADWVEVRERMLKEGQDPEYVEKFVADAVSLDFQPGTAPALCVYVNCWYISDQESAAMWRLYAKSDDAVAIQSTYLSLRNSLSDQVHICTVEYIDYQVQEIPFENPINPYRFKRVAFEHEHELRAISLTVATPEVIEVNNPGKDPYPDFAIPTILPGEEHRIPDLNSLIQGIIVSPTSKTWFLEMVSELAQKYGIKAEVKPSSISIKPNF